MTFAPGKRIQRIRKSKGLRAEDVAVAVGVALSTYYSWETHRALPQRHRRALAKALRCLPGALS